MKVLFALVFSICATFLSAQVLNNLLEDGSFERKSLHKSPSKGSPDFFEAQQAEMGKVNAADGNRIAGIVLRDASNSEFREYIKLKLSKPLQASEWYCVSFKIRLSPQSFYTCDAFGVAFSNLDYYQNDWNTLTLPPAWQTESFRPAADAEWREYRFEYQAKGNEAYLLAGNFKTDAQTHLNSVNQQSFYKWCYVYLDDFKLFKCSDTLMVKPTESKVQSQSEEVYNPTARTVVDNVITPNGDGLNDFFTIKNLPNYSQLTVFNKKKKIVFSSTNYKNDWDGANEPEGAYDYELILPNGNTIFGTLNIIRRK